MAGSVLALVAVALIAASQYSGATLHHPLHVQTWSEDIETWEPSAAMSRDCPYYHAGYDFEGRPVMVSEYGKWDSQKYSEMGDKKFNEYVKYVEKFWWRVSQLRAVDADAEDGAVVLFDFAGFENRQVSSPSLISLILKFGRYSALAEPQIAECLVINASHAVVVLQNLMATVAGRLAGRMETFGSRKEVWMPQLLDRIPADQLPPWYGGNHEFKPVTVFGK